MIITCESCLARYLVDPIALDPLGRKVKCAKCGHIWTESAEQTDNNSSKTAETFQGSDNHGRRDQTSNLPQEQVQSDDRQTTATVAPPRKGNTPDRKLDPSLVGEAVPKRRKGTNVPALPQKTSRKSIRIAWLAFFLIVTGTVGGTLIFKNSITSSWPAAKQLYEAVGLSPGSAENGLSILSVKYTYPSPGTLRIEGELVNFSSAPYDVPDLQAVFFDGKGNILKTWTFPPPEKRILPDEVVSFSTEIWDPPLAAKRIDVSVGVK